MRRGRRRWLWPALLPFAAVLALRTAGWEPKLVLSQLLAFTPYLALASLLPLFAAVGARAWRAAIVAVVISAGLAAQVLPRGWPERNPVAEGPRLRVLSANLLHGSVRAADLADAVRRERPDVVNLLEVTTPLLAELGDLLPYRLVIPGEDSEGAAILSRYPLRAGSPLSAPPFPLAPRHLPATLTLPDGQLVDLVAVHACAPSSGWRTACWASSLRALPGAGGRPRVLAGDFNATLDHAVLRDLLDTGYRDAADVTGKGLLMTWPYERLPWFVPKVAIDRVLADERVAVLDFRTVGLPRTDHRATVVDLAFPAP